MSTSRLRSQPARRGEAVSYQSTFVTTALSSEILAGLTSGRLDPVGVGVAERGDNYVVFRPVGPHRYTPDIAIALGVAIVLLVLIATALSAVIVVLLPLAVLPALPLLLDERPVLAVSAVPSPTGGTRVTAHGQASPAFAAVLDAYLAALPVPVDADQATSAARS